MKRVGSIAALAILVATSAEAAPNQDGFYPPLPKRDPSLPHYPPSKNPPQQMVAVSAPFFTMDTSDGFGINNQTVDANNIDASLNYIGFQCDIIFDSAVAAPTPGTAPVGATGLTAPGGPGWTVAGNVLATCNGSPCPGTLRTLRVSAFSNDGETPLSGAGSLFLIHWKRVSSTNGDMTALTFGDVSSGNDFEFIDTDINLISASQQNSGNINITCSCGGAFDISGYIYNCANPPAPVVGATVLLHGNYEYVPTVTDANGYYRVFEGFNSNPHYADVTPSKANLSPGSAGITTVDVIATQRHFLGLTILSGCRLTAADVNGDSSVTTVDVIAIQRFYLGFSTGTANVGKYNFNPAYRTYLNNSIPTTNQNYDALVFGDVAAPFAP